jgi:hypothetical protein
VVGLLKKNFGYVIIFSEDNKIFPEISYFFQNKKILFGHLPPEKGTFENLGARAPPPSYATGL